jgi:hypothetical protein
MKQQPTGLVTKEEAIRMLSDILRREDLKAATFDKALKLYSMLRGWENPSPGKK